MTFAAKEGFDEAQCNLAGFYLTRGDKEKGMFWLKLAASKGNASAESTLAEIAYNEKDYRLAVSAARHAASKGDSNANYLLWSMFEQGMGVTKEMKQVANFFKVED